MDTLLKPVKFIRSFIVKMIKPAGSYWTAVRGVTPISTKFGYDRGTPIDRFWIESFLKSNKNFIKGRVLEITDNAYTVKFGGSKVKKSDVADIDTKNKSANIHGDLRNLKGKIADNTYDSIILTHVLGQIDDIESALKELKRILKNGGRLLVTSSCLSPTYDKNANFWRFTPKGASYLFGKHFGESNVKVTSYGNVLTGQCFWVGMAQEDLTKKELEYNDPRFPCIVGVVAQKTI